MTPLRLVVFDWDGTLVDSVQTIVSACAAAFEDCGLPAPEPSRVRACAGLGLVETFQVLAPQADERLQHRLTLRYRQHWALSAAAPPAMFADTMRTLRRLAGDGLLLAVATGKGRRGLDREMSAHGLTALFDTSRCADEAPSKPHPGMLEEILEETGVAAAKALMVGDTEYDMEMARRAGVPAVGVRSGAHEAARLQRHAPVAVLDGVGQITEWLARR